MPGLATLDEGASPLDTLPTSRRPAYAPAHAVRRAQTSSAIASREPIGWLLRTKLPSGKSKRLGQAHGAFTEAADDDTVGAVETDAVDKSVATWRTCWPWGGASCEGEKRE